MSVPRVTVDRAIAHYASGIEFDFDATQQYYEALPYPDKRPLEDCRMHFSALAPYDAHLVTGGVYFADPTNMANTANYDPQAPESDIMVFLGSRIRDGFAGVSDTVKHELAHYAQGESANRKYTDEERALMVELMFMRGKIAKTIWLAKATFYGGVAEIATGLAGEAADLKFAAGFGLGFAGYNSIRDRKAKKAKISQIQKKIYELDRASTTEQEADEHTEEIEASPLVAITPRDTGAPVLGRQRRRVASNRLIDMAHKRLALTAP